MIGQIVRLPGFVGPFCCRLGRQKSLRCANVHSSVEVVGDTKRIKSLDRSPLLIKPQLDWKFLSDSSKLKTIRNNIKRRNESDDIDVLIKEIAQRKVQLDDTTRISQLFEKYPHLADIVLYLPNNTHPDVPIGDESKATVLRMCGTKPEFNFKPKTMRQLAERLNMLRLDHVGNTTGSRSYYLKGELAELEQALIRLALTRLLSRGFELICVPDLIHPGVVEGCGFKTSGEKTQVYRLEPSRHGHVCLAGTGEMPLAGYFANQVFSAKDLPKRVCTVSRCYRAEKTNASGEEGIYRVHHFTKVEMFGVTTADSSAAASGQLMDDIRDIQQAIFKELGLYFRVLDMPTEELGSPAYRKYDMEVWMAGANKWGEISSTSNCTDYQSRRLNICYRDDQGNLQFCHTVNGTACAVPRLLISIFETHQSQDGHIRLPVCMGGGELPQQSSQAGPSLKWIRTLNTADI